MTKYNVYLDNKKLHHCYSPYILETNMLKQFDRYLII